MWADGSRTAYRAKSNKPEAGICRTIVATCVGIDPVAVVTRFVGLLDAVAADGEGTAHSSLEVRGVRHTLTARRQRFDPILRRTAVDRIEGRTVAAQALDAHLCGSCRAPARRGDQRQPDRRRQDPLADAIERTAAVGQRAFYEFLTEVGCDRPARRWSACDCTGIEEREDGVGFSDASAQDVGFGIVEVPKTQLRQLAACACCIDGSRHRDSGGGNIRVARLEITSLAVELPLGALGLRRQHLVEAPSGRQADCPQAPHGTATEGPPERQVRGRSSVSECGVGRQGKRGHAKCCCRGRCQPQDR